VTEHRECREEAEDLGHMGPREKRQRHEEAETESGEVRVRGEAEE